MIETRTVQVEKSDGSGTVPGQLALCAHCGSVYFGVVSLDAHQVTILQCADCSQVVEFSYDEFQPGARDASPSRN